MEASKWDARPIWPRQREVRVPSGWGGSSHFGQCAVRQERARTQDRCQRCRVVARASFLRLVAAAFDLTPISHLTELKVLRLGRSDPLPDLTPLRGLRYLNRLWCYDSGDVDLTPFAGRPGIVVYVSRGQNVIGAETLGPGSRVERH